jgi:hypothetical protein
VASIGDGRGGGKGGGIAWPGGEEVGRGILLGAGQSLEERRREERRGGERRGEESTATATQDAKRKTQNANERERTLFRTITRVL